MNERNTVPQIRDYIKQFHARHGGETVGLWKMKKADLLGVANRLMEIDVPTPAPTPTPIKTNLFDLPDDILNKIGSIVLKDNKERLDSERQGLEEKIKSMSKVDVIASIQKHMSSRGKRITNLQSCNTSAFIKVIQKFNIPFDEIQTQQINVLEYGYISNDKIVCVCKVSIQNYREFRYVIAKSWNDLRANKFVVEKTFTVGDEFYDEVISKINKKSLKLGDDTVDLRNLWGKAVIMYVGEKV
jgi:hypothetical protein